MAYAGELNSQGNGNPFLAANQGVFQKTRNGSGADRERINHGVVQHGTYGETIPFFTIKRRDQSPAAKEVDGAQEGYRDQ